MLPTRRTQPYRIGAREPGPALQAMLLGRQAGTPTNGADFHRQLRQMSAAAGGLREQIAGHPPIATADVRGTFTPRPHHIQPQHWRLADMLLAMQGAGPTLVR